jgi:phosphopantetheine--protein transferase-like protein
MEMLIFAKPVLADFKKTKMDTNEIKNIVAAFLKVAPDTITETTVIDKTAIQGSILIHRMYAELEKNGLSVPNYANIKTFSELLPDGKIATSQINTETLTHKTASSTESSIGIDIERISNFPETVDFRTHPFYTQNFTANEIANCILKQNPIESFAGKFAAKEAIIKADNVFKNSPFNQLEISNNSEGKPFFSNFELSVSHAGEYVIAVALKTPPLSEPQVAEINTIIETFKMPKSYKILIVFSFLMSFATALAFLYLYLN